MKNIAHALLLGALIFGSQSAFPQNTFITDSLDGYINRAMKQWQIPGMAVAVVKDGKVVVAKGYGVREVGKPGKVDENTLFMIASNTKAFTATSLCLLEQQKRLSLDDKVTKWMPNFRLYDTLATRDVMIRDLLCHRIGLETFQGDFINIWSDLSRQDVIDHMRLHKPVYPFRTTFGYCNAAFLTAGQIIPLATDTSWDDYVKYHFLLPLKMTRTSTNIAAIKGDNNAAQPYTRFNDSLVKIQYMSFDNIAPAGSINSSVKDMSNWLLMQLDSGRFDGKQLVPFDALQETRAGQTIEGSGSSFFPSNHFSVYGLGFDLEDYGGKLIVSHSGGAAGFVSYVTLIPEEHLGIVVLTNTDVNSLFFALPRQITDAYLGMPYRNYSDIFFSFAERRRMRENEELKKDRELVARKQPPSLSLKSYSGTYANSVYGTITIKAENNKLNIYFSHHPGLIGQLEPRDGNTFLCTYSDPEYGIKVIPFTVENNQVKSVTITVNDEIEFLPYEFVKQ